MVTNMVNIPDPPAWVPRVLRKYGIGIPVIILGVGLWILYRAAEGIMMFHQLTNFGVIGLAVVIAIGVLFLLFAGYTYSVIDTTWWTKTEESDAEPVTFPDEDDK